MQIPTHLHTLIRFYPTAANSSKPSQSAELDSLNQPAEILQRLV